MILYTVGPPQNVSLLASETVLIVTWMQPAIGITNVPVVKYTAECTTTGMNTNILYKASSVVDNTTNTITMPINNFLSNTGSVYNCCVEVVYETYSSIACAVERLESTYFEIDAISSAYTILQEDTTIHNSSKRDQHNYSARRNYFECQCFRRNSGSHHCDANTVVGGIFSWYVIYVQKDPEDYEDWNDPEQNTL